MDQQRVPYLQSCAPVDLARVVHGKDAAEQCAQATHTDSVDQVAVRLNADDRNNDQDGAAERHSQLEPAACPQGGRQHLAAVAVVSPSAHTSPSTGTARN